MNQVPIDVFLLKHHKIIQGTQNRKCLRNVNVETQAVHTQQRVRKGPVIGLSMGAA
jgi:hypothetical protein